MFCIFSFRMLVCKYIWRKIDYFIMIKTHPIMHYIFCFLIFAFLLSKTASGPSLIKFSKVMNIRGSAGNRHQNRQHGGTGFSEWSPTSTWWPSAHTGSHRGSSQFQSYSRDEIFQCYSVRVKIGVRMLGTVDQDRAGESWVVSCVGTAVRWPDGCRLTLSQAAVWRCM